jgi:hypothetical protein
MIRALFEMAARKTPAPALTDAGWQELLAFADRTQLTLHLRGTPGLPLWLAAEIEARYAKNAERRRRLREAYAEAASALPAAGIDFVLLKGFTHEAGFGVDGSTSLQSTRVQYDLDILTQPGDVPHAREVFERLGYASHGARSLSEEHAKPLVRPSNWRWRGDYFDAEMPIPVELHGSAWSADRDHIHPAGIEDFWTRRCIVKVNDLEIPAFAEVDRLAFAALHVLRHVLRHDAKPAHVLELARFLESRKGASDWDQWQSLYSPELRALQTVAFQFAHEWFGCRNLPSSLQTNAVEAWFREFSWSPIANLSEPNKDTIWLHMALIENRWDRVRVFCDRMIPIRMPHSEGTPYATRLWGRFRYHGGAVAPALASGARWWWRRHAASTASEISDWKRRSV